MNLFHAIFSMIQLCIPQHLITRVFGCLAKLAFPPLKNSLIFIFIKIFGVDLSDAEEKDYRAYKTFNDFFTRALRPESRPIADGQSLCSPVDGAISQLGGIHQQRMIQAKGKDFFLEDLIVDQSQWASYFRNGSFATIYLSPKDYHRIHMPLSGTLVETRYIPGKLFSVNQGTVEKVSSLFSRNERLICFFESAMGPFAMVYVGAMIVGSIETPWGGTYQSKPWQVLTDKEPQGKGLPPLQFKKGDEVGRFKLGSTVVLITAQRVDWDNEIVATKKVQMGQRITVD